MEYIRGMESTFAIIAQPNRRAILALLASSERSVGEIERRLRMPQTSVSKHLRVLREAGFVESRVEAQRRVYRARPEPLLGGCAWVGPFPAPGQPTRGRARASPRPHGAGGKERKEAMSNRVKYAPGAAAGARVQKEGE